MKTFLQPNTSTSIVPETPHEPLEESPILYSNVRAIFAEKGLKPDTGDFREFGMGCKKPMCAINGAQLFPIPLCSLLYKDFDEVAINVTITPLMAHMS